jgi:hypothetical protein
MVPDDDMQELAQGQEQLGQGQQPRQKQDEQQALYAE